MQIATLDLELRGAGDLLGADQSGFVASVGLELFSQMLAEATAELRGEALRQDIDPELSIDVEALLPQEYIDETPVRLSLYKRLASAADEAEVNDIAREIEDRFGAPPAMARRLIELMRVKTELRKFRALGCEASSRSVTLHLADDTPLDPEKLTARIAEKSSAYRLTPEGRLTRRAQANESFKDGLEHVDCMLDELASALRA
jgi:transcription-repair coupling factor (superfamily II helicase)